MTPKLRLAAYHRRSGPERASVASGFGEWRKKLFLLGLLFAPQGLAKAWAL